MADLTIRAFGVITGLHPATIRNLIRKGELRDFVYKIGGTYRVRREAVDQLRGVPETGKGERVTE